MATRSSVLGFNPAAARADLPPRELLGPGWRDLPYVYGGGKTRRPSLALVFMNPTARNQSVSDAWHAGRSPFIGLSRIWRFLANARLLDGSDIADLPPDGTWSEDFAVAFYGRIADRGLYITNLVKACAADATNPPVSMAKRFRTATIAELAAVKPGVIVTMGTLVSSVLLQREIRFKEWFADSNGSASKRADRAVAGADVVPCFYPIGRGDPSAARRVLRQVIAG